MNERLPIQPHKEKEIIIDNIIHTLKSNVIRILHQELDSDQRFNFQRVDYKKNEILNEVRLETAIWLSLLYVWIYKMLDQQWNVLNLDTVDLEHSISEQKISKKTIFDFLKNRVISSIWQLDNFQKLEFEWDSYAKTPLIRALKREELVWVSLVETWLHKMLALKNWAMQENPFSVFKDSAPQISWSSFDVFKN